MARRTKGSVLGNMSGKVGNLVLSTWRGVEVIKEVPKKRKGKLSKKVTQQNSLFKLVTGFLNFDDMKMVNIGYQLRKNEEMSPWNAMISYHMVNAIIGEYPECSIDLTKVKFTNTLKSTQVGWNAAFFSELTGALTVDWELNPYPLKVTQLDDKAVIMYYNATQRLFMPRYGIRSDLSFSLKLSADMRRKTAGDEFFCWLFFISADDKFVSETQYLGMVNMP